MDGYWNIRDVWGLLWRTQSLYRGGANSRVPASPLAHLCSFGEEGTETFLADQVIPIISGPLIRPLHKERRSTGFGALFIQMCIYIFPIFNCRCVLALILIISELF